MLPHIGGTSFPSVCGTFKMPRVFDKQAQELMDRPQSVSNQIRRTLRELEFLNRNFGEHGSLRRFLRDRFSKRMLCEVQDL